MRHLRWLIPLVAVLGLIWWAKLTGLAVLATVVCGLAGLIYLVVRSRHKMPWPEQERDTRDVQRDIPPSSG
jgi:hypothetical protein